MSNNVDLIKGKDVKSMVEDCDKCTPESAKPVTIDELAKACEEAAELYMDLHKEYLFGKEGV